MRKVFRYELLLLLLLLTVMIFSSCTTKKIVKVDEKDRIKKIEIFFESINKRREKIKNIFIEAKADTFTDGKRVKGKLMLSVVRPDKLRIDTLSPFEQPISTMLVGENKLNFYDFGEKKMYTGQASTQNLSLFLPIRINLRQFIDMFSGISPMIAYKKHEFRYIEDSAEYELILLNDNIKQRILYVASDLQIKKVEFYKDNKRTLLIKFSKIKSNKGIKYAKKIYFEDFNAKSKLKMIITDIEFNGDIDNSIYFPIEWKYKVEDLD